MRKISHCMRRFAHIFASRSYLMRILRIKTWPKIEKNQVFECDLPKRNSHANAATKAPYKNTQNKNTNEAHHETAVD